MLLLVAAGVTVLACDPAPRAAVEEQPRMVYVALSDSATGNPVPRSTLRYMMAGDSALADSMRRVRGAATTRSAAASDSATGNPTPRTLIVTCTDDAGRSVPCRWSTTY
jgi:hypothetical protein